MRLQGKRVAILAHNDYEDLELWYPLIRLREEGADVLVVGPRKDGQHQGKRGLAITADAGIRDVHAGDFDLVVIPGGYSPDHMRRVPEMVNFVKDAGREGKLIAAICHAPWMLASAELARGRRLTSFFSIKDDMVNAGATWVDEEAVQDGNIITSRNPDDLPAFCRAIINAMAPVGVA